MMKVEEVQNVKGPDDEILVHVGTCFGDEKSPTGAILRYWLNSTDGSFREVNDGVVMDTTAPNKGSSGSSRSNNPGWITPTCRIEEGGREVCFVIMEDDPGMVHAYAVRDEDGTLEKEPVWVMPSGGVHPCHAWPIILPQELTNQHQSSPNKMSCFLVCAHYTSGSLSVLPVHISNDLTTVTNCSDGPSCIVQHPPINYEEGDFDNHRQEAPHVHCIVPNPVYPDYVAVCDLGLSTVFLYQLLRNGQLIQRDALKLRPQDGCRHCVWDKSGSHLFINNELSCTVTIASFTYEQPCSKNYEQDQTSATTPTTIVKLNHLSTINSLPKDVLPDKNHHRGNSEIVIHPNGKYIYAGCRSGISSGHIAIIEILSTPSSALNHCTENDDSNNHITNTSSLKLLSHVATYGQVPRNFKIIQSPNNSKTNECDKLWLVLGNQETKTLVSYHVHPENGTLTYSSQIDTSPYKPCNIASRHTATFYK